MVNVTGESDARAQRLDTTVVHASDIVWRGVDITAPELRGRVSAWHPDESTGGSGRFTASHVPLE